MDRRIVTLIASSAFLAVLVVVVLVAQGGDDSGDSGTAPEPEVEVPEGPPPSELVVEDLEEGEGAEAQPGDTLLVNYVGVIYETGEEFDSSFDRGQPIPVQLGAGGIIPGWEEGLVGVKEGARRQLVIPPDLAYGPQGDPPDIPPDSTLVFVIDVESID